MMMISNINKLFLLIFIISKFKIKHCEQSGNEVIDNVVKTDGDLEVVDTNKILKSDITDVGKYFAEDKNDVIVSDRFLQPKKKKKKKKNARKSKKKKNARKSKNKKKTKSKSKRQRKSGPIKTSKKNKSKRKFDPKDVMLLEGYANDPLHKEFGPHMKRCLGIIDRIVTKVFGNGNNQIVERERVVYDKPPRKGYLEEDYEDWDYPPPSGYRPINCPPRLGNGIHCARIENIIDHQTCESVADSCRHMRRSLAPIKFGSKKKNKRRSSQEDDYVQFVDERADRIAKGVLDVLHLDRIVNYTNLQSQEAKEFLRTLKPLILKELVATSERTIKCLTDGLVVKSTNQRKASTREEKTQITLNHIKKYVNTSVERLAEDVMVKYNDVVNDKMIITPDDTFNKKLNILKKEIKYDLKDQINSGARSILVELSKNLHSRASSAPANKRRQARKIEPATLVTKAIDAGVDKTTKSIITKAKNSCKGMTADQKDDMELGVRCLLGEHALEAARGILGGFEASIQIGHRKREDYCKKHWHELKKWKRKKKKKTKHKKTHKKTKTKTTKDGSDESGDSNSDDDDSDDDDDDDDRSSKKKGKKKKKKGHFSGKFEGEIDRRGMNDEKKQALDNEIPQEIEHNK